MLREQMQEVDLLILGAGWTSTFLIPQLKREGITYAATTTTGHDNTIPFKFDPYSVDPEPYKRLPSAKTVLVTFPLKGQGQSMTIVGLYRNAHGAKNNWIQLGVTSIWNQLPDDWSTEDSPYDKSDERGMAEDELMVEFGGCSLNLCGLYGGTRVPRTWLPRLGQSKDDVKKRGAVHFVHGEDVARAIVATHKNFTPGKRWLIADLRVYDWYDLIMSFSAMTEEQERAASVEDRSLRQQFSKWVGELMVEEGVRALPREMNQLGRKLDSPFLEVHRHINLTSRSAAYIAVQLTFHINCEAPMHFPEAIKCWLTAPQTIKIFMKLSRHTNSTSPIAVPLSGPIGYVSQVPGSNALC